MGRRAVASAGWPAATPTPNCPAPSGGQRSNALILMTNRSQKSDCLRHFGWDDFDPARLGKKSDQCPVLGCSTVLLPVPYGDRNKTDRTMPWCPEHGIRIHSNTFVYWNGPGRDEEARLRNFIVRHDLVRAIALPKGMKVEAHRLGYEMSEDALSWNVFESLAMAGRLREATQFLTGRNISSAPRLYLWGRLIDDPDGTTNSTNRLFEFAPNWSQIFARSLPNRTSCSWQRESWWYALRPSSVPGTLSLTKLRRRRGRTQLAGPDCWSAILQIAQVMAPKGSSASRRSGWRLAVNSCEIRVRFRDGGEGALARGQPRQQHPRRRP